MADIRQETAERLALRARRHSGSGDYLAAIRQQREAINVLREELEGLERDSPALADEREESAHRLSDYWGRLGGIYRRADMIPEGIDAYQQGMVIERQYRLDDSYNLTNWIVLQLLDDPSRLTVLTREIDDAIALIQVQVEGPRRDQWWAWADLGLVCHLGRRTQEARGAYEHFQQAGARRVDYLSVLAVLSALERQFSSAEPELAAELSETIENLESSSSEL